VWIFSVTTILDGSLILHKHDSPVAVKVCNGKLIFEEFSKAKIAYHMYVSDMNCVVDEMRK
jgi:hypothetical protein